VEQREAAVEVRIGRIEVRAPAPPTSPPVAAPAPAARPSPTRGLGDLTLARRHLDRSFY